METNLKKLEEIFAEMAKDGVDIAFPLKWGFYFVDQNKDKLQNVFNEVKEHGYKMEHIELIDENEWQLMVTKKEILTAEQLHKRNLAFNELADRLEVDCYDGWDVEVA